MVDVDSVLLSVQERDKWRRRMETLSRALEEVQERRRRLEARLRRIKQELSRLRITHAELTNRGPARVPVEVRGGTSTFTFSGR